MTNRFDRAITIFRNNNDMMRTGEAISAGIHPDTLYAMHKTGIIERVNRGLYRLSDSTPPQNPDFVFIARIIPEGVICLISALSFYDITLQIPHEVYIALPRGARKPKLDYPPVRIFRFIGEAFSEGINTVYIDNIPIRIYCMEKTIADTFKFRNQTGLDTAIEALRAYMDRKDKNLDVLMHYSKICRVNNVIRPYIEALI